MKKLVIPAVLVIFLLLALGVFAYWQMLKEPLAIPPTEQADSNVQPATNIENQIFSVQDLMLSDASFHCTFSYQAENLDASNGEMYVSQRGQKMRGTFLSQMGDRGQIEGNIVRDGQYQYFWQTGESTGMKFLIEQTGDDLFSNTSLQNTEIRGEETPEPAPDVRFSCQPWNVDENKFVVPTDVTFMDFQTQIDQLKSSMPTTEESGDSTGPNNNCAVCDQIPDADAKAQCLAAMGC